MVAADGLAIGTMLRSIAPCIWVRPLRVLPGEIPNLARMRFRLPPCSVSLRWIASRNANQRGANVSAATEDRAPSHFA